MSCVEPNPGLGTQYRQVVKKLISATALHRALSSTAIAVKESEYNLK